MIRQLEIRLLSFLFNIAIYSNSITLYLCNQKFKFALLSFISNAVVFLCFKKFKFALLSI